MASKKDLAGKQFNRWTVLRESGKNSQGAYMWLCECICGNTSIVRGADLTRNKSKSCGCYNLEACRDRWSKDKNPAWNPNLSDEDRLDKRNLSDFREWRSAIYERDNYSCKICNSRGGTLNAHHLDGWHWCADRRYDLDNGVTLCEECHNEFHMIYGRTHNIAEEFFEYYLCKQP